MDKNNKKPKYMDIVGGRAKRPGPSVQMPSQAAATARRPASVSTIMPDSAAHGPQQPQPTPAPRRAAAPAFKRPLSTPPRPGSAVDPIAARPISRPAGHGRPVAPQPGPRIVQTTSVQSIRASEDSVESFEFGIIEDLSPVVKPEPPMIPSSRPGQPRPAAEPHAAPAEPAQSPLAKPEHNSDYLRVTPPPEPEPAKKESPIHFPRKTRSAGPAKSPFLASVNVPKRPLSASAPTGIHAPGATIPTHSSDKDDKPRSKKRKNIPFVVIIILSVALGISLGALVYFVLPH